VGLPFAVRQIVAVGDPHNPTALCAVGVTADREVFTVRDQQVRRTGVGPVEALALDASGTFLFCRNGGGVEAYRNPVLERAEASIRIEGVTGRLEVGAYQELGLRVVNDGPIVIRSLRLVLEGTGRIEKVQRRFEHRLAPGEGLDLQLGAKALVRGSKVPLDVHVELEDEAGPPASVRSFTVEVAVDGA
jgi:hypothetical protein